MTTVATTSADERIDRALGELASAVEALRERWGHEPRPAERDHILARRRSLEEIAHTIRSERRMVAHLSARVSQFEREREVTRQCLGDLDAALAAVPSGRRGIEEIHDRQARDAYRQAIHALRTGRGSEPAGAVVAWREEHRVDRVMTVPAVEQVLADARRDLAPHVQQLETALAQWASEREPQPAA